MGNPIKSQSISTYKNFVCTLCVLPLSNIADCVKKTWKTFFSLLIRRISMALLILPKSTTKLELYINSNNTLQHLFWMLRLVKV